MHKRRILFAGCSLTERCGFNDNHLDLHWPRHFSQHYDCHYTNIAVGGMSNFEIFNRTMEECTQNHYDLVVVLWSSLARQWIYYADDNIDDWTNITHTNGFRASDAPAQTVAKLMISYFNNNYMNLKHWLIQIIALQAYLESHDQPYVFAKGFDNYVCAFDSARYSADTGFDIDDQIKPLLDFDHRPDYYIHEKIMAIQNLIAQVDQSHWVNFLSHSFDQQATDVADDQAHPGPISNRQFAQQLISHCQERNLLQ